MVLVPLLARSGLIPEEKLFSSALAVMLPMSLVSFAIYYLGGGVDLAQALPYCLGGLLGGLLGAAVFRKIPTVFLHRALGVLILWGGVRRLLA